MRQHNSRSLAKFLSVLFHPQALSRISSIHCTDDEVHEVGYPSVNARIARFCAPTRQDKWAYEMRHWLDLSFSRLSEAMR